MLCFYFFYFYITQKGITVIMRAFCFLPVTGFHLAFLTRYASLLILLFFSLFCKGCVGVGWVSPRGVSTVPDSVNNDVL